MPDHGLAGVSMRGGSDGYDRPKSDAAIPTEHFSRFTKILRHGLVKWSTGLAPISILLTASKIGTHEP
jgi:hypothetical protein